MRAVAVAGVAHHRVKDVLHVFADLVQPSAQGLNLQQRVTGCRVTPDRKRQFHLRKASGAGDRALAGHARLLLQRVINARFRRRETAYHSQVVLLHQTTLEQGHHASGRFPVQREQQGTAGGTVQPVQRVYPAAELITQQLHGKVFAPGDPGTVHQQARRFVYRHEMTVAVKYGQSGHHPMIHLRPSYRR